jgi:hypothetical protein
MREIGIYILRLKNEELIDMDVVLQNIKTFLDSIPQ